MVPTWIVALVKIYRSREESLIRKFKVKTQHQSKGLFEERLRLLNFKVEKLIEHHVMVLKRDFNKVFLLDTFR